MQTPSCLTLQDPPLTFYESLLIRELNHLALAVQHLADVLVQHYHTDCERSHNQLV